MKTLSLLTLLTILFAANSALAQPCPCDAEQLSNGLTGNDIVDLLCPGGTIAEGNIWTVNPGVVAIGGEVSYQVLTLDPPICQLTDFINPAVNVALSEQQLEACRARLIRGCNLIPSAIPTLSEWGMIAMAGVLGIIGLAAAARRRKVVG